MKAEPIFVSLGSNLGDREYYLSAAAQLIENLPDTTVVVRSLIYQTAPVGFLAQPDFLNQVLKVYSRLMPREFLSKTQEIEYSLGRERIVRWGPRTIDIDILYWGSRVIKSPSLTVPHKEIENRRFVLEPLCELAPDFLAPPQFKTICALLEELPRDENVDVFHFDTPILF